MEMLLLLFLFSTLDKNSNLKETLQSFLGFYRENRDLISMLAGARTAADGTAQTAAQEPPAGEMENRLPKAEKVDSVKILEEYLKRTAN